MSSELIKCPNCNDEISSHYIFCVSCGARLKGDSVKETKSDLNPNNESSIDQTVLPQNLISEDLANGMLVVGWIYFLLSLIGGIIIWVNSSETHYQSGSLFQSGEYVETVNYTMRSIGIVGVFTSIIVLLICCGIARAIKQNIFIIKKLS